MSEFNIGDKARCIQSDEMGLIVDEIYTVIDVRRVPSTNQVFIRVGGKFCAPTTVYHNGKAYGVGAYSSRMLTTFWWRDPEFFELVEEDQDSLLTPLLLALGAKLLKHLFTGQ